MKLNKAAWARAGIAILALAMLGTAAWYIYPPLAGLLVGGLIWFDLSRNPREARKR